MKDIILKKGEFSKNSLNKAISALSNVSAKAKRAHYDLSDVTYFNGINRTAFKANSIAMADKACRSAMNALTKLEAISPYLDNGPQRLFDVDAELKRKPNSIGELISSLVSDVSRPILGAGLLSSFFNSVLSPVWNHLFGSSAVGSTTVIDPYSYLADRFDWSKTTATQEEISAVIRTHTSTSNVNVEQTIVNELTKLYDSKSEYNMYREKANMLHDAVPIGDTQRNGWCTYSSTALLMNRKQVLAGETPSFTTESIRNACIKHRGKPGQIYSFGYTSETGAKYSHKSETADTMNKKVKELGLNSKKEYIVELLKENPAGVVLYAEYPGSVHAILITDFEIDETTGEIQLYADDPVNNRDEKINKGRIPIEKTFLFKKNPNCIENCLRIWY